MRSVPTPALDGLTMPRQVVPPTPSRQFKSFHFISEILTHTHTHPLVRMRVARDVAEAEQIAVKRNLLYYVLKKNDLHFGRARL